MRVTENDKLLSHYFAKKIEKGEEIPYITKISEDTGVSVSTISRYAIRKGFYNFPEMRAKINNDLNEDGEQFDNYSHIRDLFLKSKDKRFVVATSVSCQSIGYHITKRLVDIDISCRFIDHQLLTKDDAYSTINSDEVVIFITISGESAWLSSLEKRNKNETIIISMQDLGSLPQNYTSILIPKKEDFSSVYNKYQNIRKIFLWADDILNTLTIELKK